MVSVTARVLLTCLVAVAVSGASGKNTNESPESSATTASAAALAGSAGEDRGVSRGDKALLVASNLAATGLGTGRRVERSAVKPVQSEIGREWLLIGTGMFLIWAMSYRRSRSMTD